MFLPAPRQFSLSAETKATIQAKTDCRPGTASLLLRAARKAREQFQNQWLDFSPGTPLLAKKRHFDVQTDGWVEEQVLIQLDTAAFGKGAVRECFRMKEVRLDTRLISGSPQEQKPGDEKDVPSKKESRLSFQVLAWGLMELPRNGHRTLWVAKRSIADHHRKFMHRRECEMDVIHQTFAKHYAELFNQAVHRRSVDEGVGRCGAHDIDFLLTHVVDLPDKCTYSAEAFMLGEYYKHNTNGGSTMGPRQTPQSFSYFTFIKSGRRLMIVDIQGVGNLYTDPVIHFLPSKVSGALAGADIDLNFGIRGFALFLWSHRRNEIDQLLGLPAFALSPHEEKHISPTSSRTVKQLVEATLSKRTLSKRRAGIEEDNSQAPGPNFSVNLKEISIVDLSDWCDWRCTRPRRRRSLSGGSVSSWDQEPGVEAECHMEIACMYNDGRITLRSDEMRGPPRRAEVESAIFHIVEAARQDLPEALLALARLASPSDDHKDFFPQVRGSTELQGTQLALLSAAAALGSKEAMASLAALVLSKEPASSDEELQLAAEHLEAYAIEWLQLLKERALKQEMEESEEEEEDEEDEEEEEEVDQEHNSLHRRTFGWEAHGFTAAAAARRAAAIFSKLPDSSGSAARLLQLAEDVDTADAAAKSKNKKA